ncbi:AAA family ATPase [Stakelama sp. CBK3Z-3]|uniref:AAA family ATPase n=1 Tax=Stakelama flava TaxID=2860338 RepID=A0ABS6XQ47_9SPHN|nr:ATP-binding protein [Stakelama flava]MBW4332257.1 AAA family ATPase [Stakelama flava]MBW4332306.1 AAA family ATPase [Stakelama flava]
MARIRHIGISNFRCIEQLNWFPAVGINCLIGPGDAGKSSILDAIDFCLGARRTVQFTDADFHGLNVATPIVIRITIGDLSDALKSMETYGAYVRGFDPATQAIDDEPEAGKETVLTVQLTVDSDLDPVWTLVSDRAQAQGLSRNLTWGDRTRLAPTRIGALAESNLAWRRGSVLNRLTEEKADTSAALASAARDARKAFGNLADAQLGETLKIVADTARELGIPAGDTLKAMLDAHSVSFSGGTVALHGDDGVPLRALGVGSTRLLVAGLQRKAAKESSVLLVDELEHGLEPHRIIRLLGSIGAKEAPSPIQAFVTTHSPVALRELRGDQLWIVRKNKGSHGMDLVGTTDPIQGTIRAHPEAFLSRSVLVCEGASETGLMRGLDLFYSSQGTVSLNALGVALVDAGGVSKIYGRANVIARLGYRTASLRDDDVQPDASEEEAFQFNNGTVFKWAPGQALEHAIFHGVSDAAVHLLLERAIEIHGEDLIAEHISAASQSLVTLATCQGPVSPATRQILAVASKWKKNAWFKTVTWMEEAARDIIAPDMANATPAFQAVVGNIYQWCSGG